MEMGSGAAGVWRDDVLNKWLGKQNPSEFQYKAVFLFCFLFKNFIRHLKTFDVHVLVGVWQLIF